MIFDLSNQWDVLKFSDKVKRAIDEKYTVTLSRKLPQRTIKQNAYLHLLLGYFASETGYSIDEVKYEFFKKRCNPDIFFKETVNKHGQTIVTARSSKDLDTGEMTLAIERFRNYSASEAKLYLPTPDDYTFLTFCEQQIQETNEYLYM